MDIFEQCQIINNHLNNGINEEFDARNKLIKLLDYHQKNNIARSMLVNHLIRQTGLYPYLKESPKEELNHDSIHWQDRFVYEAFKVDVGGYHVALHREQSMILKQLLDGENLAVSAPTSFGKSFIIDAFITLKKPTNIVIIVPTIALMDETRRRLYKKFSREYKIITTADISLSEKNIFVFPQERAIHYVSKLEVIDLLVVDEFYKASAAFDKDRSPMLINAIMKLGEKSKQKYFLAPNISKISQGFLTSDLKPIVLNFNTVCLDVFNLYDSTQGDETNKNNEMLKILLGTKGKTIIFARTYENIYKISNFLLLNLPDQTSQCLQNFIDWLQINYSPDLLLVDLLKKGVGIHNGRLHRPLSQIQIKLFEEQSVGLNNLISTSSIIEGINTSAENIIAWSILSTQKQHSLDFFGFKNLQGRAGRMFKHFIGNVYVLDREPESENTQLAIDFPDQLVGAVDIEELESNSQFTPEQVANIIKYKEDMKALLGHIGYSELERQGLLKSGDSNLIFNIAKEISDNPKEWKNLSFLNSELPQDWGRYLNLIINKKEFNIIWEHAHGTLKEFVMGLANNWTSSIPEIIRNLLFFGITIDDFFKLERIVTFKLSSLLNDINVLQKIILKTNTDISPFIAKVSNAFLPPLVYQLEEYGLPRMISKKIHNSELMNLERIDIDISQVLEEFRELWCDAEKMDCLYELFDKFDQYLYEHFIDGITSEQYNKDLR